MLPLLPQRFSSEDKKKLLLGSTDIATLFEDLTLRTINKASGERSTQEAMDKVAIGAANPTI